MHLYQIPKIHQTMFESLPSSAQYGLNPDCSSNVSGGQCIDTDANHPIGGTGAPGYVCLNNVVNLNVFLEGASDRGNFPCKVVINGSGSGFTIDDTIVASCFGNAGILYFLDVNVSSCTSVGSVQIECDSTASCTQLQLV